MAEWVFRTLSTRLREVVVCDARRNRLVGFGSKSDRIDADKLSELLRLDALHPVYIVTPRTSELRKLVSHYQRCVLDRVRIITRLRALFRQHGIKVAATRSAPHRVPTRRLPNNAVRQIVRANLRQLELASEIRNEARRILVEVARGYAAFELLQTIPYVGELRAAELLAILETPNRFASRKCFWAFAGLALIQRISADRAAEGSLPKRESKGHGLRLNSSYHPRVKRLIREIAMNASIGRGALRVVYERQVAKGKRREVALNVLARKIANILIAIWRSGQPFDPSRLTLELSSARGEHPRPAFDRDLAMAADCQPTILAAPS